LRQWVCGCICRIWLRADRRVRRDTGLIDRLGGRALSEQLVDEHVGDGLGQFARQAELDTRGERGVVYLGLAATQ
jgi:hypothetical protein